MFGFRIYCFNVCSQNDHVMTMTLFLGFTTSLCSESGWGSTLTVLICSMLPNSRLTRTVINSLNIDCDSIQSWPVAEIQLKRGGGSKLCKFPILHIFLRTMEKYKMSKKNPIFYKHNVSDHYTNRFFLLFFTVQIDQWHGQHFGNLQASVDNTVTSSSNFF